MGTKYTATQMHYLKTRLQNMARNATHPHTMPVNYESLLNEADRELLERHSTRDLRTLYGHALAFGDNRISSIQKDARAALRAVARAVKLKSDFLKDHSEELDHLQRRTMEERRELVNRNARNCVAFKEDLRNALERALDEVYLGTDGRDVIAEFRTTLDELTEKHST